MELKSLNLKTIFLSVLEILYLAIGMYLIIPYNEKVNGETDLSLLTTTNITGKSVIFMAIYCTIMVILIFLTRIRIKHFKMFISLNINILGLTCLALNNSVVSKEITIIAIVLSIIIAIIASISADGKYKKSGIISMILLVAILLVLFIKLQYYSKLFLLIYLYLVIAGIVMTFMYVNFNSKSEN